MNSSRPESVPLNQCKKVFIPRDYTHGMDVKFSTRFPDELRGKITEQQLAKLVRDLNIMYADAEKINSGAVCENLMSCVTCHLSQLCVPSQYDKQLAVVADYLRTQNDQVFQPSGVFVADPIERGLRVIEISLLFEPAPHPRTDAL